MQLHSHTCLLNLRSHCWRRWQSTIDNQQLLHVALGLQTGQGRCFRQRSNIISLGRRTNQNWQLIVGWLRVIWWCRRAMTASGHFIDSKKIYIAQRTSRKYMDRWGGRILGATHPGNPTWQRCVWVMQRQRSTNGWQKLNDDGKWSNKIQQQQPQIKNLLRGLMILIFSVHSVCLVSVFLAKFFLGVYSLGDWLWIGG